MKKLCIFLAFILAIALTFPVLATDWAPAGTPLFIEGPAIAETGETIQISIVANPECGADSFSGRPVTEGLQFVSVQGGMSSEDSLIILGSLGASEVTYTYLVTAKSKEQIRFTLENADMSNGVDLVSCSVPAWCLTVGSEMDGSTTGNEPETPGDTAGFAPLAQPLHILGPGWGSIHGDTIEITVTLDPSSGAEAASASISAGGLKIQSVTGALNSQDMLTLMAPDSLQATYICEVTAQAGEEMSFCLKDPVVSDSASDAQLDSVTWTQTVRFTPALDMPEIPPAVATPTAGAVPQPEPAASSLPQATPTTHPAQTPLPLPTVPQPPSPTSARIPVDLRQLKLVDGSPLQINCRATTNTITGYTATRVDIGTSCAAFKAQFVLPSDVSMQVRSNMGGILEDEECICTGLLAVFKRKWTQNASAQIIVMGDVNGTGLMSLGQMVRMAQAYKGMAPLQGVYLEAGDFNETGRVDLSDVVVCAKMYKSACVG